MFFEKEYNVKIKIDLDAAHNDAEWAVENWETSDLMDFIGQVREDVEQFIADKENK